jgi:tetratricopeptide (TPR) repeat protein
MKQAFIKHLLKIMARVWLAGWPVVAVGLASAISLVFVASSVTPVWAQVSAQENPCVRVQKAIDFVQHGQFEDAVNVLKPVVGNEPQGAKQLSGVELGRAYVVLGDAYKEEGKFAEAQSAFEQSLRILEQDGGHKGDYASALENYAGLYDNMGQIDVAATMWMKALRLRQLVGDHAGAMLSLINLAEVAIAQKQFHEAHDLVKKAIDEMKLARDLTEDDTLVVLEMQAALALAEGKTSAALTGYQQALKICQQLHGERHWLTGWEYMLRGKAQAQAGDVRRALTDMREGLEILGQAGGSSDPKYFAAEIAYAQVLDQSGAHVEAARLKATAEQARKDLYGGQCAGCTISVAGFR